MRKIKDRRLWLESAVLEFKDSEVEQIQVRQGAEDTCILMNEVEDSGPWV